jgi:hypothetical protein
MDEKMSDEDLKQDLLSGLTISEVTEKYGYSDESHVAKRKTEASFELRENTKLAFLNRGGANIYFSKSIVDDLLDAADLDKTDDVFVHKELVDGMVCMSFTSQRYTEKNKEEVRES